MLDKTISQALEPNPDLRCQSAEEMREALEAALREPEQKRRRRRRLGFAVVGVVLAFIAGVGGVSATKPDVRARAWAVARPLIDKVKGTQEAVPTEVAAAAPAAPPAAEPAEEVPAAAEQPATAPAEQAAADPASLDDESDDDGSETDTTGAKTARGEADDDGTDEPTKAGEPAKAEEAKAKDAPGAGAKADGKKADAKKSDAKKANEKVPVKTSDKAAEDEMFSSQPLKTASGDKVEELLAKAAELMQAGKKLKAFNEYRKIGRKHRKDARALKAWSETAAQMKGYGEALRVAKQWASVDKSIESRMHLAGMQRKVGKREDAIKTLNALLQERPGLAEARSMLKSLSPEPRVAQR